MFHTNAHKAMQHKYVCVGRWPALRFANTFQTVLNSTTLLTQLLLLNVMHGMVPFVKVVSAVFAGRLEATLFQNRKDLSEHATNMFKLD